MTEKRFTRHKSLDGDCTIYDELNDFQFPSLPLGVSKIFYEKLNELAEENIKLHIQNDFLKDENHHMRDLVNENRQLKEENKELKQELLEIIDASSDNRPNKKGFAGTGRFA